MRSEIFRRMPRRAHAGVRTLALLVAVAGRFQVYLRFWIGRGDQDIAVDVPVLAFAMVTTVLTTLVFAALSMGRTIAAGARQGFGAGSGKRNGRAVTNGSCAFVSSPRMFAIMPRFW